MMSWSESTYPVESLRLPRGSTGEVVAAVGNICMRSLTTATLLLVLALVPSAASAVTLEQIVSLSKSGVSEPIILALIDRDKTVFTIEPEQLVQLRRDGLSETIILAMLKSGREEGEAAAAEAAALNTAAIMSTLSPVPEIVVIGHDPERPTDYVNRYSSPGYFSAPPLDVVPMYYGSPYYGVPANGSRFAQRRRNLAARLNVTPNPPPPSLPSTGLCTSFPTTRGAPPMVGSRGYVVPCPPGVR